MNKRVDIVQNIVLHVEMEKLGVREMVAVVRNSAVSVLLGA